MSFTEANTIEQMILDAVAGAELRPARWEYVPAVQTKPSTDAALGVTSLYITQERTSPGRQDIRLTYTVSSGIFHCVARSTAGRWRQQ